MLKKLFLITIFISLLIPYSQDVLAGTSNITDTVVPGNIMENLYMANTLGKINDMTAEMEIYCPPYAKDKEHSNNTFEPFSDVKLFFMAPNKLRNEITLFDSQANSNLFIITIYDGEKNWPPYPVWPPSRYSKEHCHSLYLPFNIETLPRDQYRKYSLTGEKSIGGRDAYVITITNEKEPAAKFLTLWIDKELFIPLKEEYVEDNGADIIKTVLYKEPKQMPDGRWLPFRMERYDNGKMICYILYKSAVVNQGLSEDLFDQKK